MSKIIIDSNLYIQFIKTGSFEENIRSLYTFRVRDIYFSSIVLAELLQGSADGNGRKYIGMLSQPFEKVDRIITPNYSDWKEAGSLLSKIREKRKDFHLKVALLINDTLLAMSARRIGATIYTSNGKDFELLSQTRAFQFKVV